MSSLKQIAANRLNAEKSTGPKTEEGKVVVSKNATKHGLLSSQTFLPSEDSECLERLGQGFHAQLQPQGELELLLVDRIVAMAWRLRRAGKIEADILTDKWSTLAGNFKGSDGLLNLHRYETALERGFYKALHELQRVQAMRLGVESSALPVAVDIQTDGQR